MLDPIHQELYAEDQQTIGCQRPEALWEKEKESVICIFRMIVLWLFKRPTFLPTMLIHCLSDDDKQESEEMKPFPDITTSHLE